LGCALLALAGLPPDRGQILASFGRHGIPTARYAVFSDYPAALCHLHSLPYPVVIKASGLAAGKGVIVPHSVEEAQTALQSILLDKEFGEAGAEVVIEERLEGEEISLLAFTDGNVVYTMPPAQDHKRLLDGDQGPNTGGMGAFAPAPLCPPEMVEKFVRGVLQPAVDGLRAEGMPFVGVLYAGLMLTLLSPCPNSTAALATPRPRRSCLLETDLLKSSSLRPKVACKRRSALEARCCRLYRPRLPGYPGKALCKTYPGLDLVQRMRYLHASTVRREQILSPAGAPWV
jgi:hypothetical protein